MRRNRKTILPLLLMLGIINTSISEEIKKRTYTGRVIDYNARPVEGATVICYQLQNQFNKYNINWGWRSPRSYEPMGRVKTTADGHFSFQAGKKDFSPSYLLAGKDGLALGWRDIDQSGENIIRLGRPSRFKGTVVDEKGHPVPNARVRICLKNERMMRYWELAPMVPIKWFTALTDKQGHFLFDNVPEGATADFGAEAPGRALTWTTCDFGLGQGEQFTAGRTDIRIVMPPEGCIKGRVINHQTGEPLASVQILARPLSHANRQNYHDRICSDSNGNFTITGLTPGKHLLQTMSDEQGEGNITITVETGQTVSDVEITLTGCPFEVRVYDEEKENPIEDAKVTLKQINTETKYTTYSQQKTTDANGLALFCAPPGECELQVIKFGYGTTMVERHNLMIDPSQTQKYEVLLRRSAIILSGEVLDGQGLAASGVSVMQASFGPRTITDADGRFDTSDHHYFSSRLPSKVTMLARHTQSGMAGTEVFQDPNRTGKLNGRIILKPAYVLTGRVADPLDKGIPAASVKLVHGSNNTLIAEIAAGPDGMYRIRSVPHPGDKLEYAIVTQAEGFGQAAAKQIQFHDDTAKPVQTETIILQPADEVISGLVTDSNDQPVAGVSVSVYGQRIIRNYRALTYGRTFTDEKGRYRIAGVPKVTLSIDAWIPSSRQRGETIINGGGENVKVVLGQKLIFSPSLIGKPLPDLKDLKVGLSPADIENKMILICFFDMEQRPSRNCLRQLSKRTQELRTKDVVVIAVQASKIDEKALNEWAKKHKIPFTVGMVQGDEEKTRFSWGVRSLPWLILTDQQHIVRAEGFGLNEINDKIKEAANAK